MDDSTMQALDEMIYLAEQFYANEAQALAHTRNDEYLQGVRMMIDDAKSHYEKLCAKIAKNTEQANQPDSGE